MLCDDFRLVAPDLPGFGQSDHPPHEQFPYTFATLAKVIASFTDIVGLKKYAMYIFDYGAPVGLRLALEYPDRVTAIISQNGNAYIDGVSVCRMFNRAVAGQVLPKHLSTDHDPLFRFHCWLANLRVLEIKEIKSVPYVPISHPFVERLIGTVRREYLDRVFFWNTVDLERKLASFRDYYNSSRVHRSLDGTTPAQRAGAPSPGPTTFDQYGWRRHCRGLFQTPVAA